MKKIKKTAKKILLPLFSIIILSSLSIAEAAPIPTNCSGEDIQTVLGCVKRGDLKEFVKLFFIWTAGIISTLSMLGLIYAGYTYITSAGNPDSISRAKDIVWTSIAALLIVIFSWALFSILGLAG